jgi:hypothetical protein
VVSVLSQWVPYIIVGVLWWVICFVVDLLAHLLVPMETPYKTIRWITYGIPVIAALILGSALGSMAYGLVFLSPIIIALVFDCLLELAEVGREMGM